MAKIDIITPLHRQTKRNFRERVVEHDKAACSLEAKKFGENYWDGDRRYGYGGYHYDGRWQQAAEELIAHYQLQAGQCVLDVGCGKAFLLYEMKQLLPGLEICGLDLSDYALAHAREEVKPYLQQGLAQALPFVDNSFDLVLAVNSLHNLYIHDLAKAIEEINRVGGKDAYIVVESYRNEQEKANLLYWQLTCECFFTPEEWEWLFARFGYRGDYSFIFFE